MLRVYTYYLLLFNIIFLLFWLFFLLFPGYSFLLCFRGLVGLHPPATHTATHPACTVQATCKRARWRAGGPVSYHTFSHGQVLGTSCLHARLGSGRARPGLAEECVHLACVVVGPAGRVDVQLDQPRGRSSRLPGPRHCAPPGPLQMLVVCMYRATTGALWR